MVTCVSACALVGCGDDDAAQDVHDYADDVAAVQAILDANGLGAIPVLRVGEFKTIGGEYLLWKLDLRPGTVRGATKITTIPADIGVLTECELLYLDSNQITTVSANVGNLRKLRTFTAKVNSLETLPVQLFNCTALEQLDLSGNALSTLATQVGQLSALRRLDLNTNQISILPDGLAQLSAIEWFDFDNNRVCELTNVVRTWYEALPIYDATWRTRQNGCP